MKNKIKKAKCDVCENDIIIDQCGNGEQCKNCGWRQSEESFYHKDTTGILNIPSLNNVNLDVLLDAVGKKLDSKYSSRWGYRKTLVVNIETFEREEEDDFTYTVYTQTAKAGFKTKHPHNSFMLPVVCLGDTEYIRSKNYIMAEEHINLLGDRNNIGLIGIEDGEFASPEWQDLFWKVYRDHLLNIAYQMQSQVDSREDRLTLEEQLIKEFGEY